MTWFVNTWDWWTLLALVGLIAFFTWLTGCMRYLDREAHDDEVERERWLSAARCQQIRDGDD